jgi:hypothetical protein
MIMRPPFAAYAASGVWTLAHLGSVTAAAPFPPPSAPSHDTFGGDTNSGNYRIAVTEKHNAAVKATIPPQRLLVYDLGEGWAPLAAFLGVPAPDTPFPRENTTESFKAMVALRKAKAANEAGTPP